MRVTNFLLLFFILKIIITGSGIVTINKKGDDIIEEDGPTKAMESLTITEKTKDNLTNKKDHLNHAKAKAEKNEHLDQIKEDDHLDNGTAKKGRTILGRGGAVQVYRATKAIKATKIKNGAS